MVWVEGLETEADLEYGVIDSLFRTVGAPADVLGRPKDHIEVGLIMLELLGDAAD